MPVSNYWEDTGTGSFTDDKVYVVQTGTKTIQRCILMATDPGDLVLDPTCGSGTTAYVAEQWGRRWITIDTSRVALALARTRLMAARYPYYLLADSPEGQRKEGEVTRTAPKDTPTHGDIRQGFVCERVPHRLEVRAVSLSWCHLVIDLQPQPDGAFAGRMTIDGAPWDIRGWKRTAAGQVQCEARPVGAAEFEEWLDAHAAVLRSG